MHIVKSRLHSVSWRMQFENEMAAITRIVLTLIGLTATNAGFTTRMEGPKPIWNATFTDKLRQDLLLNYDKFARPAQHFNATTVKFGLTLLHFTVNEFKSAFTVHAWLKLTWRDEKLQWNTSDYGNITVVHLADHEIWQPDLFVYNSATATAINSFGNTHVLVYSSGEVLWVPPTQFSVLCNINLRYWPFDQQKCMVKFGSWTYHGDQINLILDNNATNIEVENLVENNEWKIVDSEMVRHLTYYACCAEPYPDVTINITVNRVSPSYSALIISPALAVIFLTLMTFWLPPQAGEKIILQGVTAFIICLFLVYFAQKLPALGSDTPLIVQFYSTSLYVICCSMMVSIVVIWISRTPHTLNLPWRINQALNGWLGKLLCLGHYTSHSAGNSHRVTAEEMRDHHQVVNDLDDRDHQIMDDDHQIISDTNIASGKCSGQHDWVLFAVAIDRLAFYVYALLFAILAMAYAL